MAPGTIRIIGGEWRGRKLCVLDEPGLRPTPNRIRETLFNWLQQVIAGANCLDMFAGTGALGFEALSRGAAHVDMLDSSLAVVKHLQQQAQVFQATDKLRIYQGLAPEQIKKPSQPYDLVFLDPPFQKNLLLLSCQFLEEKNLLASVAYVYLESAEEVTQEMLPAHWELLKNKKAGHVFYHLAKVSRSS